MSDMHSSLLEIGQETTGIYYDPIENLEWLSQEIIKIEEAEHEAVKNKYNAKADLNWLAKQIVETEMFDPMVTMAIEDTDLGDSTAVSSVLEHIDIRVGYGELLRSFVDIVASNERLMSEVTIEGWRFPEDDEDPLIAERHTSRLDFLFGVFEDAKTEYEKRAEELSRVV